MKITLNTFLTAEQLDRAFEIYMACALCGRKDFMYLVRQQVIIPNYVEICRSLRDPFADTWKLAKVCEQVFDKVVNNGTNL